MNRKIILIGPCGGGDIPKNGASAKNFHLVKYLMEKKLPCLCIDTEHWKRNPFVLLRLLFHALFSIRSTFIVAANSMSSYRIMRILSMLPGKRTIIYWAIGGCVADWIKEGKVDTVPYKSVSKFIVEGQKMRQTLAEVGFSNVIVVPNFKHIKYIPEREDSHDGVVKFVFLSRIIPEKGCDTIIEAAKMLNETYKDNFSIDFWGPFENSYQREFLLKIRSLDNVNYKGFLDLSNPENYDILADYDIMLFPTRWHGEGFPGIIIDAFVAGLPVIATDWSLNADIIKHGKTGVILNGNTVKDLQVAMLSFIEGKEDLNAMRGNCRHEVLQYDIHNVLSGELLKESAIM